ncbi:MAG: Dabb family protein [Armatimonadota bacterium]
MFIHAVYFWLKEDLTSDEREAFVRGLQSLAAIEEIVRLHIGIPAATDRPVIDRTYSYALIVEFASPAGQDAYQGHPLHTRFVQECAQYWTRVQIYDSVSVN